MRYYFKHEGTKCLEPCPIRQGVTIGSTDCSYCSNCGRYSTYDITITQNNWLICKELTKKLREQKFKRILK